MKIICLSLFPGYFTSPLETSLVAKARESGLVDIELVDIRDYATGSHATVDDRAYGGGPGMVLMAEPVAAALRDKIRTSICPPARRRVLYMSPQGIPLTAERCRAWASYEELVILCGHYEGVDERIIDAFIDEEVSIGDYVLTNGCLSALVVMDATLRFVPGVVGKEASTREDSFEQGIFDHPHYTRPQVWEGRPVPAVLLCGDHDAIARYRKAQALGKTQRVRPELFLRYVMREQCEQEEEQKEQGQEQRQEEKKQREKEGKKEIETIILPVTSLKKTKRFYRECFKWKPTKEWPDQLLFSLEGTSGTQQLIFVEKGATKEVTQGVTFTIPSHAMRFDKSLMASASGYCVEEVGEEGDDVTQVKIRIWWEDPDGYRWSFTTERDRLS